MLPNIKAKKASELKERVGLKGKINFTESKKVESKRRKK